MRWSIQGRAEAAVKQLTELAERARWFVLIAGFIVLLSACVLVYPRLLEAKERVKAENDVRTTLLQGIAGLLLLAGGIAT